MWVNNFILFLTLNSNLIYTIIHQHQVSCGNNNLVLGSFQKEKAWKPWEHDRKNISLLIVLKEDETVNYKGDAVKRDLVQKQRLRHFCGKRKHKEPSNEALKHLYVFEKYKLIFCLVPKVAIRQWMLLLGGPGGYGPTVKRLPPEKARHMLQNFYKFMFVREPFERLLSAYKDKYVHPRLFDKNPFITVFGRKIIRKFRPNASQADLQSGYGVNSARIRRIHITWRW